VGVDGDAASEFGVQAVFEKYGRKSRRELFLDEMDQVVPWVELQALVEPHYPKAGGGRRPVGVAIMLRVYFGLKAHIGVDSRQGVVHSVCTSAASVGDKHMLPDLLHGEERKVWGDGGYQGQRKAIREAAPHAQDMTCRRTKYKNYVDEVAKRKNTTKSRVRAKVEDAFRILKRIFGFDKVRYRGLAKNHHRLCANFALVNLYLHRKRLTPLRA
jgi:hypothetical protein